MPASHSAFGSDDEEPVAWRPQGRVAGDASRRRAQTPTAAAIQGFKPRAPFLMSPAGDEEQTRLMSSADRQLYTKGRMGSVDFVLLASAKMTKVKEVPPPTWFEGAIFAVLSNSGVAGGLSVFMLVGGMCPVASNFITASCGAARCPMPAAVAGCGLAVFWVVLPCGFFAMRDVWRPRSSGGGTLTALAPPGMTITAEVDHRCKTQCASLVVIWVVSAMLWSALATIGVVTEVDGESSSVHAYVHRHSTDWLLPPVECTTSETRNLLATWALYGFVPTMLVLVILGSATFVAIILACALGEDAIDEVSRDLGLRAASLGDKAWATKVRDPIVALARSTIPLLDQLGVPVGALVVGFLAVGFCQIPKIGVMQSQNEVNDSSFNLVTTSLSVFALIPVWLVFPIASIGSSCDDLLERLNELLVEGDVDEGIRRVMALQQYLSTCNRRQGLGVRILSIVVDKPKLGQIVTAVVSIGGSLAAVLWDIGQAASGTTTMPAVTTCSMTPFLRYELWQAINTVMVHEGGANATCSYEQLALPAFGL